MDDDELITAAARGDDRALRELFNRHSPWMAGRLRRSLPPDAVEDVLQETFLAVWRGSSTYTPSSRAGAWLWGIARRQAAMWARTHRDEVELVEASKGSEGDLSASAANKLHIQAAMEALGPESGEQRKLFEMLFIEERPVAEIAARLGIPQGAVKSRAYRIRQTLQAVLREGGY